MTTKKVIFKMKRLGREMAKEAKEEFVAEIISKVKFPPKYKGENHFFRIARHVNEIKEFINETSIVTRALIASLSGKDVEPMSGSGFETICWLVYDVVVKEIGVVLDNQLAHDTVKGIGIQLRG